MDGKSPNGCIFLFKFEPAAKVKSWRLKTGIFALVKSVNARECTDFGARTNKGGKKKISINKMAIKNKKIKNIKPLRIIPYNTIKKKNTLKHPNVQSLLTLQHRFLTHKKIITKWISKPSNQTWRKHKKFKIMEIPVKIPT